MAVATIFCYEKVRRTMRTVILSYLLKSFKFIFMSLYCWTNEWICWYFLSPDDLRSSKQIIFHAIGLYLYPLEIAENEGLCCFQMV